MLTKNQNMAMSFFLTRALFLGGGMSSIFALSGKDAWISGILGIILGIGIIYLINLFGKDVNGSLKRYLAKNNLINISLKILFFLFYSLIIFIGILSITTLVSSYYLNYTPSLMICIPIVILLIYLTMKGTKVLGRVAQIIFPLCLFITITKIFLLMETAKISYFLPLYTYPSSKIFIGSLIFAILSSSPFLLLIDEKVPLKQNIINYLIGSITGLFIIINITSVLGDTLLKMFSYPEYAILRKIEFFNFFENVENLIAFIWLGDLFIMLATSVNRIKNLFAKPDWFAYIYLIIIVLFITLYVESNFAIIMFIYNRFIYLFGILLLLILIGFYIKHILKKKYEKV